MNIAVERSYPTPVSNSTLLPLLLLSLARQRHSPDGSTKIKKEYDYVIVGAGSAGSVLANRLSEVSCVNVLLLEAGREPPLLTDVPAFGRNFWFTDLDWQYRTAPQKYTAKDLINREMLWPSGKSLGGSTIFNANRYVRGNRKNYDDWEAMGAKGWSYKDVFPYFLKLEDNKDLKYILNGYHSTGGPLSVHVPRYETELKRAVYKAITGLGYKVVDVNGRRQTGFYDHQASIRDSQRCSAAKAYLVPAENRTNLDILPDARARKIIIRNKRARGIQFDYDGHIYEVKARREVIISAGAVNSPQLLMLSGIGPKRELQRLNIPMVADLPVGENFHDHAAIEVPYESSPRIPEFASTLSIPANIQQYIHNRTGPLASTEGISFLAFLRDQEIYSPVDFPNYQLYLGEMGIAVPRDQTNLLPEVYRRLFGPYENKSLFTCIVSQLQPRSRGSVTLRSKDPYDMPVIDPKFLADPRDVEDLVQGMKTCQRIVTSKPLRKLGIRPFRTLVPGCEMYADDEDHYFRCFVRHILTSIHHPAGSAKMGDPMDPTTVVDPELRVKFIKGLRVVDGSVMPILVSGNTNVPIMMIAEKASDLIKDTIHCHKKSIGPWNKHPDWAIDESSDDAIEYWDQSEDTPREEENSDPKYQWNVPGRELWRNSGPKTTSEKYAHRPVDATWFVSDSDDEDYSDIPQKSTSSKDGKHYLTDSIKDPRAVSYSKIEKSTLQDHWKGRVPNSWYQKREYPYRNKYEPVQIGLEIEDKDRNLYQSKPDDYKSPQNVYEFVELADIVRDVNSYSHK